MSEIKQIIELKIASGMAVNVTESFLGNPVLCPACCGGGGWDIDERSIEYALSGPFKKCDLCSGTGFLVPYVSIDWKPVKK